MIHVEEKQGHFVIIVLCDSESNSEETKFLKERSKKPK